ncbi:MAG: hypothetical protein A2Y14_05555 [Verrucomicrobia bacterium GWF2_51_19]|nr:MAG: hypothetical protein A2Y14_05555 [Verrucomicrobia bacterium GWF2_51_19]
MHLKTGHLLNWHLLLGNTQTRDVLFFHENGHNNGLWADFCTECQFPETFQVLHLTERQCRLEKRGERCLCTLTYDFNEFSLKARLELDNRTERTLYWHPQWNFQWAIPWLEQTTQAHYVLNVPARKCLEQALAKQVDFPVDTLNHTFGQFKESRVRCRSLNEEDGIEVNWPLSQNVHFYAHTATPESLHCRLSPAAEEGRKIAPFSVDLFELEMTF